MSTETLAISASPGARTGALLQKLRDLRPASIVATQGTFDYLLDNEVLTLDKGHAHTRLRPGIHGGVTQIATHVVEGGCCAAAVLSDPADLDIESPAHRALIRMCVHWGVPLLLTVDDIEEWLRARRGGESPSAARKQSEFPVLHGNPRSEGIPNVGQRGDHIRRQLNQQTIAVVSHDKKKLEMLKFVNKFKDILSGFDRIIAPGTTGQHVHELTGLPVMAYDSGPEGGDVRIAREIMGHTCHWLVFFVDTLSPHPHDADVRVLQKSSQIPGVYCRALFSRETAESALSNLGAASS